MRRLFLSVLIACGIAAFAIAQPPAGGGRGPAAPTNLKVLTPENLTPTMFSIVTALGVRCDFCHNMADRASDEKPEKLMARKMLLMVKNINDTNFGGEQKVVCYTCHHGEQKPAAPPPPAARGGGPGGPGRGAPPQ